MTKIKLYSIGNGEEFNFYIFDKKQKVAEYLSMILSRVSEVDWEFDSTINKNEKLIHKKVNIEKYKDYHETIGFTDNFRVDVFYGDKKMFITINCSEEDRLKFNEELFKIAEMPKPNKKKIPKLLRK